jgi:hypothetical protein
MAGLFDIFTGQSAADAAGAQIQGITAGKTAADTSLGQGRDALTTNYTAGLQPFLQNYATANKGVGGLTDALGLTGDPSQVQARFAQTPGYQFQLQQGDENVLRNSARTGQVNSGATNLDLQKQGQGLANQTYQQYVQNLQPFLGAANTAASGIGNISTGLGNALNQNYGSEANLGYTAATGVGNANANADLAKGKGVANLWNAGMDVAGMVAGLPPGTLGGGGGSPGGDTSVYGPGGSAYGATPQAVNGGVYPSFAEGGKPPVGRPSIVGERGPELFVPDRPGTVVPSDMVSRLAQFMNDRSVAPANSTPSSTLARFLQAA